MTSAAIALSVLVMPLLVPGSAAAEPPEREHLVAAPVFETDQACGFPLRIEEDPEARGVVRTWRDDDGTTRTLATYSRVAWTLTNLTTGEQHVVHGGGGSDEVVVDADGTTTTTSHGRGVWGLRHPVTGEPGLFLIRGHRVVTRSGSSTSFELVGGSITPLCPLLA